MLCTLRAAAPHCVSLRRNPAGSTLHAASSWSWPARGGTPSVASSSPSAYTPHGAVRCASSSSQQLMHQLEQELPWPLYERPAQHSFSAHDLLEFMTEAKARAADVGDGWQMLDGGPTGDELTRELDWLLDDAVAATRRDADHAWMATKWIDVSRTLAEGDAVEIQARASLDRLHALWSLRMTQRVPFQYIVGAAHWRDDVLAVGPGVLCPRPETELLIEEAAAAIQRTPSLADGLWADLGTGSGAIAVGLAHLLSPRGAVVAVDVSPRAAAIARLNAVRCGVGERVRVVEGDGDWYGALREHDGTLAGVVSNPPYIPSATLATLQAEVRRHEPALALDGGDVDGMRDLTAIAHGAARALRPGGLVALETGGGEQPTKVAALLREGDAFVDVRVVADLAGIARHVVGVRSDAPSAPE